MNRFWQKVQTELELAGKSLHSSVCCPEDLMPHAFRAREQWIREKIDSLCLHWARFERWPELSKEDAWWVAIRITKALRFVIPLTLAEWTEQATRDQVMRWCLVDTWPLHVSEVAQFVITPINDDSDPPPEWLE
jgi:hypothetical protein